MTQYTDVLQQAKDALEAKCEELGFKGFHVSWSDEWLDKVRSIEDRTEREAEIAKGIRHFMQNMEVVHNGDYEEIDLEELERNAPQIPDHIKYIIRQSTIEPTSSKLKRMLETETLV